MALVDDHQRIVRQVIDQRGRRLARRAAGEMARVVFDAFAEAELREHLQIETRALLDALRLDEAAGILEELDALTQLLLDGVDGTQRRLPGRDVMARGIDREARHRVMHPAGERIEDFELLDLIVEERYAHRLLGMLRRKNVDHIAAHPERPAAEIEVAARVLHGDEPRQRVALRELLALAQVQDHAVVFRRIADAVDRRHRTHDHRVAPLEQRLRCRKPHLLDVVVDRGILLDVEVPRRHIGLGLVVVVVRDEVFDRVLRKELPELAVELRRQGLVRREHQRRPAEARDDVRHGEGLARAGDTQQRLEREAVVDALDELVDRFRLVAGRRVELGEPKRTIGELEGHGRMRLLQCETHHFRR